MEPTADQEAGPRGGSALIVQNGRCAGTRRPLGTPLTFIGRAEGCDIRLNIEGVDDLHCLIASGPDSLVLRDLGSAQGTLVNGQPTVHAELNDGDLVTVGPFQFLVNRGVDQGDPGDLVPVESGDDGLQIQAAAVAAQQAALDEEEERLDQRQSALDRQEERLALHLEEKKRRVELQAQRNQADRAALQRDRADFESHFQTINKDLHQAQDELAANQQKLQRERNRLADLHRRLRQRYHRFWLGQRQAQGKKEQALILDQARLEAARDNLQEENDALGRQRLRLNTEWELKRQQIQNSWDQLRQAQFRWRQRRGRERAVLKIRRQNLEQAERDLAAAQSALNQERGAWEKQRQLLHLETEGLDQRARNQRRMIQERTAEAERLEALIRERQGLLANLPGQPGASGPETLTIPVNWSIPGPPRPAAPLAEIPAPESKKASALKLQWQQRLAELEQHAGDLADQRLHLLEQWQRLAVFHQRWHAERDQTVEMLEDWSVRLQQCERQQAERAREQQEGQRQFGERQDRLNQLRDQLIAWRSQLLLRECAWDGDRQQLLADLRDRETYAEHQLQSVVDLKLRWQQRRQQELNQHAEDRAALTTMHQFYVQARKELADRLLALDHDKRVLAEKALVLEQYRQEFLAQTPQAGAERRLERLRRRWLTQNAAAIRTAVRERENLAADLAMLDDRFHDLQRRVTLVEAAQNELINAQTAWEHQQSLEEGQQARLLAELDRAEIKRTMVEQQFQLLREEIERIAQSLYDDPEGVLLLQAA